MRIFEVEDQSKDMCFIELQMHGDIEGPCNWLKSGVVESVDYCFDRFMISMVITHSLLII